MFQKYVNRLLTWCLGSKENPFQYVHHAVLLIGAVIYFYFGIANYLYELAHIYAVVCQFIVAPTFILLWYLSRWRGMYQSMCIAYVLIITLVSLPINWIGNAGSAGPTYFLNLGILIYISLSFRDLGAYRVLGQILAILMPIPLIMLEQHFPNLIYTYPTSEHREFDLTISFVVTGLFLMWMMSVYSNRFKLERDKAERLTEQLRDMSEKDSLTGLYNRRVLERSLDEWAAQSRNYSLALLDIDHFKSINDEYGHNYGDNVLRRFASLIEASASSVNGLAVRQGGEEFVILLPQRIDQARLHLQSIASDVASMAFDHGCITFSAGVVEVIPGESQHQLLKRADDLMYDAKRAGRNRVIG